MEKEKIKEYEELTNVIKFEQEYTERSIGLYIDDMENHIRKIRGILERGTKKMGFNQYRTPYTDKLAEALKDAEYTQKIIAAQLKRLNLLHGLKEKDFKTFKEANGFLLQKVGINYKAPFDISDNKLVINYISL